MRIALISQEYPPETARGGIGSQAWAKAHGLARRGHEVWVISHGGDSARCEYDDASVRVLRIAPPDSRLPIHTDQARWAAYSQEVASAVAELEIHTKLDLIEFPEYGAEGYFYLLNRTEWNRTPVVVHLHGPLVMLAHTIGWPEPHSPLYRVGTHMEGMCVRLADGVMSSSECSTRWCAEHYGLDPQGVPVLHTGVDTSLFRPLEIRKAARPTIVFAGRVCESKGAWVLLRSALLLAREYPDLHLRMLGSVEPGVTEQMQTAACEAGYPSLLELPGYTAREELPQAFSVAHVFAAPSRYEGGPGFVYLEAMACGLPVIACAGSGASEAVVDGKTGILVSPGDVEAVRSALSRLLADSDLRGRMGRAAQEHVRTHADSEFCLNRIEAFYAEIVARRGS